MRSPRRSFHRHLPSGLLALAMALTAGCAPPEPGTPIDATALARMAREGEAGLRALGEGRFEVLDFQPEPGSRVDLLDPFLFHTRLYSLPFTARIRFVAAVSLPSRGAIDARIGAVGWTIEESESSLALHEVLSEGAREAQAVESIRAAAVFLDLEPGLRFDRIDRPR